MLADRRRSTILELLGEYAFVETSELARLMSVSELTVRRDLTELETEGFVRRVRGGAVATAEEELSFKARRIRHAEEKQRIAERAAELVEDGDCVLLEAGTTVSAMVPFLRARRGLRVVTHAVNIAASLLQCGGVDLTMIGGTVRPNSWATVGVSAEAAIQGLYFEKLFLSCDAITLEHGLTAYDENEAQLNRKMIQRAAQCYLLADHSKFGKDALYRVTDLTAMTAIITGAGIDTELLEAIRAAGVEVHMA
jgi:DeoR/GlpR family transcriptional regulator of sugar metabolism